MPSNHLSNFKKIWTNTCHTMWVEILAIRSLESYIKGNYASISKTTDLTEIIYAPEVKERLNGVKKDNFLNDIDTYIRYNITTTRVVLLSAAFETYFSAFLDDYLESRPKYFSNGNRTVEGDKVYGEVRKARVMTKRIEEFSVQTGAKIENVRPKLPVLGELFLIRNSIAHNAGICDLYTSSNLSIIQCKEGERILISPEALISQLAPPCIEIAEQLDKKRLPAT